MAIRGTVKVITDTHGAGLEALLKRMSGGEHQVVVGVPEGKRDDEGKSLAEVGAMVEFGTVDSPERPFMRGGIRAAQPDLRRLALHDVPKIARGEMTIPVALERTGLVAVGAVKRYMVGPNFAPNAPSTIAKKGSSQPTVEDGQLRQSVTHIVQGKVT